MLHKLKNKLIRINLILLFVMLFAIFLGIYFSFKISLKNDALLRMNMVAKKNLNRPPKMFQDNSFQNGNPPPNDFIQGSPIPLIKVDIEGNITQETKELKNISNEDIEKMVKNIILENPKDNGIINIQGSKIRYLKMENNNGYTLTFSDKSQEDTILNRILIIFIGALTFSLLALYFVSLYMANKSMEPVEKVWENQKNFVSDASHELRTPLSVINTNLDIVLDETGSIEENKKWLLNMKSEVVKMTKLIDNLLFLAREDSGEEKPINTNINLSNTLKGVIASLDIIAKQSDIIIVSKIQNDIYYEVNEIRITQLFTILIENAIKYGQGGEKINVALNKVDGIIKFEVTDYGMGIDKVHLDKIFARFYKVDESRTRTIEGTGLGLSIAKTITDELKGKIEVKSKVGEGSTFSVTFK